MKNKNSDTCKYCDNEVLPFQTACDNQECRDKLHEEMTVRFDELGKAGIEKEDERLMQEKLRG